MGEKEQGAARESSAPSVSEREAGSGMASGREAMSGQATGGESAIGEDDWEVHLRQLVHELDIADRVEFRGFQEDIWAEFSLIDLAVHASTTPEPFGQVVLEAMASGVPVIASDEGGPAEVVTDGRDGLLVRPRDPRLLADALLRLAGDADLRATLVEGGRETARQYRPERTAEGLLAIYRTFGTSR